MIRARTAVAGVAVVALVFQAVVPALPEPAGRGISDSLIAVALATAAVTYARRARREPTRRARAAVTVGALSAGLWSLANVLFLVDETTGRTLARTPASFLSVAAAVLLPLGVHLLAPPVLGAERYRRLIDIAAVSGAVYALTWLYVLMPAQDRGADGMTAGFATLLTAPEIVAASVACVLMSRNLPTRAGRAPRLLGVAAVTLAAAALLSLHSNVNGRPWYSTGAGAGYLLSAGLIAVACHLETPKSEPPSTKRMISGAWAFLPYVPILLAVAASAAEQIRRGVLSPVLVWVLLATFMLVLARQFITVAIVGRLAVTLERQQAELAHQADHDALTGLPNRSCFHRSGAELVRAGPGHSMVLLLDLDGFKPVNDDLGHAAGDEVLIVVAARLRVAVRPGDLVARLGGDEFVLVLAGLDDEAAGVTIARRILETISHPIPVLETTVRIGGSIGLTLTRPGVSLDTLVSEADTAMYAAKSAGKGTIRRFVPHAVPAN
ncbi:GGDEF domain-containing protein [Actinoplanes sp. NPDC026619]|uniref:GGDEF domain-containing protein n=1 Tax=Actinoplanes sp. NPDC026619 TaxID=3155798 RepID=UPI0033FEA329